MMERKRMRNSALSSESKKVMFCCLQSMLASKLLNLIPCSLYPFPRELVSLHGLGEMSQYLWLFVPSAACFPHSE